MVRFHPAPPEVIMKNLPKINIQKLLYTLRHKYMTLNNVVIVFALLIAANWVWGALEMMQRNYTLQKEVDSKHRQLQLTQLQRDSLALEKRYYQTDEYQELAVRESMGFVMPGERTLLIPRTSNSGNTSKNSTPLATTPVVQASNMEQWLNFLFGGNSKSIERTDE